MRFIETPIFTSELGALLTDDEYLQLQLALLLRPEAGSVIPGGAGVRKLRWRQRGRGKRGGLRIIYYWHPSEETLYMLLLYRKTKQSNLTPEQLRILRQLVQEDLK